MCLSSFRKIKTKNKNPTYLSIFFRSIIWEPENFFCMALQTHLCAIKLLKYIFVLPFHIKLSIKDTICWSIILNWKFSILNSKRGTRFYYSSITNFQHFFHTCQVGKVQKREISIFCILPKSLKEILHKTILHH